MLVFHFDLFYFLVWQLKEASDKKREPFDGRKEKEKTRRKDQDGHCSEKGGSTVFMDLKGSNSGSIC